MGLMVKSKNNTPYNSVLQKNIMAKESLLKRFKRDKYILALVLPCMLWYILFKYVPMFGLIVSFKNYKIFEGLWASEWVGFKYYIEFFYNPDAYEIVRNTFLLGVYKFVWEFPAPIILALLLNELRMVVFKRVVQTISYLPHFVSTVVVVSMVTMFLSPTSGIVNQIIGFFGIEPINFLSKAEWFRTIYISSDIWQGIGWGSIIYLAALSTVSPELYEASEIDGANRWKQTWNITIPGIMPAIVILLIMNIGKMLETGFEKAYLLQNQATYETSDIISTYVYRVGLVSSNFSYGAAIDFFMAVISFIFVYSANYLSRKVGETSLW